ncbi:MAG: hypothetical protein DME79_08600 [Verrucomicrobia bacterium]|nr:MAG: hypothetical protein DME79_08600 [Verrucomicrobiota bacterium]
MQNHRSLLCGFGRSGEAFAIVLPNIARRGCGPGKNAAQRSPIGIYRWDAVRLVQRTNDTPRVLYLNSLFLFSGLAICAKIREITAARIGTVSFSGCGSAW